METICIFPEEARSRRWVGRFEDERVRCCFVPRTRNVVANVRLLLREYDPVIFHTHFFLYDLCPIVLKLLYYRKSKIVWHYHNPTLSVLPQRIKDVVKLQLIGRFLVDRYIAVGDGVYDSLIGAGLPSEKVVLVRNGINTLKFAPDQAVRSSIRESFGISEEHHVFLMLGLDPLRKGVDIYVKAGATIAGGADVKRLLVIVGRKETKDFVSKLPEYSQLGVTLQVIDPREDFSSILNGVDIMVSCSRSEAFSYAIAEAMAAEKIVLSSDAPGMREIYGDAKGVWFFPSENWEALAGLMKRAGDLSLAERSGIARENSQYVRERYSVESWAESIEKLYRSVLGS